MITSLFKNTVLSYFIALIFSLVLWGIVYFKQELGVPVSLNIVNQEVEINRSLAFLISFILTIIGGFYLNYKLKKYLFSYDPSNLFLLFYILLSSIGLNSNMFLTYSAVSFLLIFLVNYLLYFIEKKSNENQVFNAAFIIGLLVLQNFLFILLIPLLVINLGAIKRISIKDFFLILVGFVLPSALIVMLTLLTGNIDVVYELSVYNWSVNKITWYFEIFYLILIFIAFKGYRLIMIKRSGVDINTIRLTKNMFAFFIGIIIISFLSLFLFEKAYFAFIIAIPLSLFLSDFFANTSIKLREIAFIAVVVYAFLISV